MINYLYFSLLSDGHENIASLTSPGPLPTSTEFLSAMESAGNAFNENNGKFPIHPSVTMHMEKDWTDALA